MSKSKGLSRWIAGALAALSASVLSAQTYGPSIVAGRMMSAAAAQQVEKTLTGNPNDLEARAKLLAYYALSGQDPAARAARLRHVEWLIRNEPGSLLLRNAIARLRPSDFTPPNSPETFRAAWREQVDRHPEDPVVIENSWQNMGAVEVYINGGERAAAYLKRLRVLEPGDPEWALDLAGLYALALPSGRSQNAPADARRRADAIAAELQKSTDAAVVGLTGAMVYGSGRILTTQQPSVAQAAASLLALSESLLRRAGTLNSKNPAWTGLLAAPPPSSAAAMGAALNGLLQESDLWPGGVVPALPAPDGATRLSAADEAARRPTFALDGLPANLGTDCSVQFDAVIGADGRIKKLQVTGFEHLNIPFVAAERDGLRQVKYAPVIVSGRAVDAVTRIDAKCPKQAASAPPAGIVGGVASAPSTSFSPPPPPPPPPPPAAPLRVGGNIKPPRLLQKVEPVYPPIARSAKVVGVVILDITIAPDGHVRDARVLRSIPLLDQAALDAVRQYVYEPTIVNGAAVAVTATVTVNFSLQ